MSEEITTLFTIHRDLGRVEGKVDGIHKRLDIIDKDDAEQEVRMKKIEGCISRQKGALAIIGVLASALTLVGHWLAQNWNTLMHGGK